MIDVAPLNAGTRVVFGATVELADADSGEETTYQIVGDLEADIKQGLISISSPIARALIGKHEGDDVTIEAPGGQREYEIVAVRYLVNGPANSRSTAGTHRGLLGQQDPVFVAPEEERRRCRSAGRARSACCAASVVKISSRRSRSPTRALTLTSS